MSISVEPTAKHVEYICRPDGIHELIFRDISPDALAEWYGFQVQFNTGKTTADLIRQIFDLRQGLPSGTRTIAYTRKILSQFPNMPHHRIAVLYPSRYNATMQVFIQMLNLLRAGKLHIRYYVETQRDAAIAWVLADK